MDLDDYNPFDGKTQNQSPAVMNPTEDMPPPAEAPAPQTQPKLSTADFQVRQSVYSGSNLVFLCYLYSILKSLRQLGLKGIQSCS